MTSQIENADKVGFIVEKRYDKVKIGLCFSNLSGGGYFRPRDFEFSDWRRLALESCGFGWVDGQPINAGRYVVRSKKDPNHYGLATIPDERMIGNARIDGGTDIPMNDIGGHFRIPDPPKNSLADQLRRFARGHDDGTEWNETDRITLRNIADQLEDK